jgi:hypothetical protein
MDDVQTAAPSAAETATQDIDISSITSEQRDTWLRTGKLPETPQKEGAEPSPAPGEAESDIPSGEEAETAGEESNLPEPESGQAPDEPKSRARKVTAEQRIRQLTAKIRELEDAVSRRQAEQPAHSAAQNVTASSTQKPQMDDVDEQGQPRYRTLEEYFEALSEWKAAEALRKYRAEEAAARQQRHLQEQLDQGRSRYPDLDDVISPVAQKIYADQKLDPMLKHMIDASPVMVDLLYVMGSKPDDFEQFVRTAERDPAAAIRQVVVLERLVMEELGANTDGAPQVRDSSGKFARPAEKKITTAPPVPREVAGKGTPPPDDIVRAVEEGDFRAYMNAANARELKRRKG